MNLTSKPSSYGYSSFSALFRIKFLVVLVKSPFSCLWAGLVIHEMNEYFYGWFLLDGKLTRYTLLILFCCFRFDGNFNTNVSRTVSCDRLSTTVNSRAFNPGRDLNSGQYLVFHFFKVNCTPHIHTEQMYCLKHSCFHFKEKYHLLNCICFLRRLTL